MLCRVNTQVTSSSYLKSWTLFSLMTHSKLKLKYIRDFLFVFRLFFQLLILWGLFSQLAPKNCTKITKWNYCHRFRLPSFFTLSFPHILTQTTHQQLAVALQHETQQSRRDNCFELYLFLSTFFCCFSNNITLFLSFWNISPPVAFDVSASTDDSRSACVLSSARVFVRGLISVPKKRLALDRGLKPINSRTSAPASKQGRPGSGRNAVGMLGLRHERTIRSSFDRAWVMREKRRSCCCMWP